RPGIPTGCGGLARHPTIPLGPSNTSRDGIVLPNAHPGHRSPRRRFTGRRFLGAPAAALLAVAAGFLAPAPALADPAACPPAAVSTATAARVPLLDWSENVGFD